MNVRRRTFSPRSSTESRQRSVSRRSQNTAEDTVQRVPLRTTKKNPGWNLSASKKTEHYRRWEYTLREAQADGEIKSVFVRTAE
jgi:hypothetical protein